MKISTLPEKPYESFEDFLYKKNIGIVKSEIDDSVGYTCRSCWGSGEIPDPSQYDVYEGYKLADRIMCGDCNGHGNVSVDKVKREYDLSLITWFKVCDKIIDNDKKIIVLMNKVRTVLSSDEMDFLFGTDHA